VEIDNIRAATDWASASNQIILALRMVGSLRRFWVIRSHDAEGLERTKTILEHPDALQPTMARLKAMNAYFFLLWPHSKINQTQVLIEEAIELGAELGDQREEAFALLWAGVSATEQGNYPRARLNLEQSREKWQDTSLGVELALSQFFLGEIAMFEGDTARAESLFETAILPVKEVKDYPFLGLGARRLGQIALKKGQFEKAFTLISESLDYNWKVRDYRGTGACLAVFAAVSMEKKKYTRAAQLFGAVDAVLESTHIPLLPFDQYEYELNRSQLRGQLEEKTYVKFWDKGKGMTIEEAISFALE
jgi:non-specific serine/threonine protein kinase